MSATRSILYWFSNSRTTRTNSKAPQGCTVILKDGSTFRVTYSSWNDRTRVAAYSQDVIGHATFLPAIGRWCGEIANPYHPECALHMSGENGRNTETEMVAALFAERDALVAREEATRADPVAHLERELSRFDWYAHMSDDDGVYRASEHHWKSVILPLKAKVGDEVFEALRVKHFPKEV